VNEPATITVPLREWIEQHRQLGLLRGALLGLRFQVDAATRERIDNVLRAAGQSDAIDRQSLEVPA
jgi:hypothetical protein